MARLNRRKVYLIICEGNNKTEFNYLSHFRNNKLAIDLQKSEDTDPESMIKRAKHFIKKNNIDFKYGDKVFCLMDIDLDANKSNLIKQLQIKNPNITIVTSNPCIESWFLYHFVDHPQTQRSSQSNKNYLRTFIPNYTEKMDVYTKVQEIRDNLDIALVRSKNKKKLLEQNYDLKSADAMHCTFVDDLITQINSEE